MSKRIIDNVKELLKDVLEVKIYLKGVEVYGNIHDTPELINDFYREV